MAVPWINFLAPSMGGIGPIELSDLNRLGRLQGDNGIPFYAGRFYPKDSQAIIEDLTFGLISETPPWLTWEQIKPTQIWMVPVFEDERIISTATSIERIDVWPRDPEEDDLPEWDPNDYDLERQYEGWSVGGSFLPSSGSIDPGITIRQNTVPPLLFAGYVGISDIEGYCTEYAFYDQEYIIINGKDYEQPQFESYPDNYREIIRLRSDGAWRIDSNNLNFNYNPIGQLNFPTENGYPVGGFQKFDAFNDYMTMAITEEDIAGKWGNDAINGYTRYLTNSYGASYPKMGQLLQIKPSELDTVVYTIKTSCVTAVIPDGIPGEAWAAIQELGAAALESLGSNLTNNVWYFYLPVRFNAVKQAARNQFLLNRAGIKRRDDPEYYAE
jgi:hypothetical protein